MKLPLADLDPELARRIVENPRASRIALSDPPPRGGKAGGVTTSAKPRVTPGRVALGVLLVPLLWLLSVALGAAALGVTGSDDVGAVVMLLLGGASPLVALNWVVNGWRLPPPLGSKTPASAEARAAKRAEAAVREPLSRRILESTFDAVVPVGPQKIYARSVLSLMDLAEKGRMTEAQARDVLTQLNALMEADRELIAQASGVEAAADSGEDRRLRREREEIEGRLAAARDSVARQALEHSRALLETRLANHDSLALIHERILAQREAIEQTLGSLESALTRLKLVGDGSAAGDALSLARLQETVAAFNRESRAVEQAVQEVAGL